MRLPTFLDTGEARGSQYFVVTLRISCLFRFFSHLVDVFGRRDFLPPICMLLLEKSANRVVRQAPDELQNTLSLPITLFQQSGYDIQIHVTSFISLLVHI
jgi:hypothetical protein